MVETSGKAKKARMEVLDAAEESAYVKWPDHVFARGKVLTTLFGCLSEHRFQ